MAKRRAGKSSARPQPKAASRPTTPPKPAGQTPTPQRKAPDKIINARPANPIPGQATPPNGPMTHPPRPMVPMPPSQNSGPMISGGGRLPTAAPPSPLGGPGKPLPPAPAAPQAMPYGTREWRGMMPSMPQPPAPTQFDRPGGPFPKPPAPYQQPGSAADPRMTEYPRSATSTGLNAGRA
jgi:hypothetical protein